MAGAAPDEPARTGRARRDHAAAPQLHRERPLRAGAGDGGAARRVPRPEPAGAQRAAADGGLRARLRGVAARRRRDRTGDERPAVHPDRAPAVPGGGGRSARRTGPGQRRVRGAHRGRGRAAAGAAGERAAARPAPRGDGPARGEPGGVGAARHGEPAGPRRRPSGRRARRPGRGARRVPAGRGAAGPRPPRLRGSAAAAHRRGRAAAADDADLLRHGRGRHPGRTAPGGLPPRRPRDRGAAAPPRGGRGAAPAG